RRIVRRRTRRPQRDPGAPRVGVDVRPLRSAPNPRFRRIHELTDRIVRPPRIRDVLKTPLMSDDLSIQGTLAETTVPDLFRSLVMSGETGIVSLEAIGRNDTIYFS